MPNLIAELFQLCSVWSDLKQDSHSPSTQSLTGGWLQLHKWWVQALRLYQHPWDPGRCIEERYTSFMFDQKPLPAAKLRLCLGVMGTFEVFYMFVMEMGEHSHPATPNTLAGGFQPDVSLTDQLVCWQWPCATKMSKPAIGGNLLEGKYRKHINKVSSFLIKRFFSLHY